MVGATIAIPLILAPALCIEKDTETDEVAKAELLSTIFFVSGLATFLQTTFGSRYKVNVIKELETQTPCNIVHKYVP